MTRSYLIQITLIRVTRHIYTKIIYMYVVCRHLSANIKLGKQINALANMWKAWIVLYTEVQMVLWTHNIQQLP